MSEEKKKIAKIVIDRNLCIGAASCVVVAGGVFEIDEENKAVMILKDGKKSSASAQVDQLEDSEVDYETLLASAQSCPTLAISLFDEDGNKIFPD